MRDGTEAFLAELSSTLRRTAPRGFVDLYLERVHEVTWRRDAAGAPMRSSLRREGAAVRCGSGLHAADGCDRIALARLLGVSGRHLPPAALPPYPAPPAEAAELLATGTVEAVRWRWSWAAVVGGGRWSVVRRPVLGEVSVGDGRRRLHVWPPPPAARGQEDLPRLSRRPTRPAVVLLGPSAAAVLLHEIVGHRLEADGGMAGPLLAIGSTPFRLPIDVIDDPRRFDLPGGYSADDEGSAASSRVLVAGGRVVGWLGDRAAAARHGVPAGNARRAGVFAPPRPRMSNLIVTAPGTDLRDLRRAASLEVTTVLAGTVEASTSSVWLTAAGGYALRAGERRAALPPLTLRVALPSAYAGILAASADAEVASDPGWCRKHGEVVPTGAIAPCLLVEGVAVR